MILMNCSELPQEFSYNGSLFLNVKVHATFKQAQTASHCNFEI
jgi:hypothetical protein